MLICMSVCLSVCVCVYVACAFPYVIAFTADTMEIRLIINGNLVHTIAMPNLSLITSKQDIFFASTAPEFLALKLDKDERCHSPPSSQSSLQSKSPLVHFSLSLGDPTFRYAMHFSLRRCTFRDKCIWELGFMHFGAVVERGSKLICGAPFCSRSR
jgi:hypothetical protein